MRKIVYVFSLIIGIVFLLSGLSKMANVFGFQKLIAQYGFPSLHILAPFIVLAEITIGSALFLRIKTRLSAVLSLVLLTIFTAAYTYGSITHGIRDCGCFGNLIKTESPFLVYIRNIILIGASLFVFMNTKSEEHKDIPSWKKSILLTILLPSVFISGMTSMLLPQKQQEHPYQNKHLSKTRLKEYAIPQKHNELVFFISYSCPHCLNSIENYKSYKEHAAVDTTLCYVLRDNNNPQNTLRETFMDRFPDVIFSETDSNIDFVSAYPTAFYIENDTIKQVIVGELPSPFVLFNN